MHWSRMEPAWTNIWKVAGYPYLKTILSWTHLYIAYIWADIWHILHVYGLTVTSPLISIIWCFRPTLWYLMTFWVSHSSQCQVDYLIESWEMLNGENQCREIGEGPDCDSSERLDICKPSPSTNFWNWKLQIGLLKEKNSDLAVCGTSLCISSWLLSISQCAKSPTFQNGQKLWHTHGETAGFLSDRGSYTICTSYISYRLYISYTSYTSLYREGDRF